MAKRFWKKDTEGGRSRKCESERVFTYVTLLVREIFLGALAIYLLLLVLEAVIEGFVSDFLSLDILVAVVLVTGVITMLTYGERVEIGPEEKTKKSVGVTEILLLVGLGLLGAVLVLYKTVEFGRLSFVLSAGTGFVIIILSPEFV
ncbi:MAG: hypothetical protein L6427_11740 [Actinomycetia bacterium]|nr:hypothetical protein [Actinomycetes bacterium]